MIRFPGTAVRLIALTLGLVASAGLGVAAAGQQPAGDEPISVERIRAGLQKTPARPLKLDAPLPPVPAATFKVKVEQRRYVLTLEEELHKEFDLTPLQRQSREWASKCCGIDLGVLIKPLDRALQRRKERQIRERITRELAELMPAQK